MQYWLMKSEPDVFGIDHLRAVKTEPWDGVRNYQARNMMRDQMKKGDLIFFYHSSCPEPGITGVMKVARESYPDHTSWNPESKYYDPKSTEQTPRWFMVDVKFVKKFKSIISLAILKEQSALAEMPLLRKGNRLSIMPVAENDWQYIMDMR